jgi:hypothetical protein
MAKVQFSVAVGDLRNKAGGAVFTKTRFGSMVRRKVSPVQPRSSAQMNVRANFTALAKLWSDTTMDAYRAAWIGLADSYPVKDVFGASQRLTGLQMFMRLNRALNLIGVSPILPPPATLTVPYPGALTLVHDGPPVTSLTLTQVTAPTAAENGAIFATAGISVGRAAAGARFRWIRNIHSLSTNPINLIGDYTAKFGTPITGRKIFFRMHYINATTGAMSLDSEASITI